jgi:hypothetical protein
VGRRACHHGARWPGGAVHSKGHLASTCATRARGQRRRSARRFGGGTRRIEASGDAGGREAVPAAAVARRQAARPARLQRIGDSVRRAVPAARRGSSARSSNGGVRRGRRCSTRSSAVFAGAGGSAARCSQLGRRGYRSRLPASALSTCSVRNNARRFHCENRIAPA